MGKGKFLAIKSGNYGIIGECQRPPRTALKSMEPLAHKETGFFYRDLGCEIPNTDLSVQYRLRVSFATALLGISIAEYSSQKTIRVLHSISGLLHPLSLRRKPRHSPCFPRQKLFSYNKLGLYFMVGRAKPNQRSVLSPFLSQLSGAKHITGTVACCLQSSEWVATTYILHVFLLEKQ